MCTNAVVRIIFGIAHNQETFFVFQSKMNAVHERYDAKANEQNFSL